MKVVDEALLAYFRQKPCEICGHPPPNEPHHVYCRGLGGGSRLDICLNLITLCGVFYGSGHHNEMQHRGKAGREECCRIIAKREGLESGEVVWDALMRKLREVKP